MTVVDPSALPYKRVCGNCKLGDIYRQQSGNYHCNLCKMDAPCSFVIHINATIAIEDARSVAAFVSTALIEAVNTSNKVVREYTRAKIRQLFDERKPCK